MTMENTNTNSGASKIELSKTQIGVGMSLIAAISAWVSWFFTARAHEARAAEVARINNAAIASLEKRLASLEHQAPAQAPVQAPVQAPAQAPVAAAPAAPAATVSAVNTALAR